MVFSVCFVAVVEIRSCISQPLVFFEFSIAQALLGLTELF